MGHKIFYLGKKKLLTLLLISLLVLANVFLFVQKNKCSETNSIETSLEVERAVRNIIGINADTDSLKLGKISPSSGVKRSITVNSTYDAEVEIILESNFSSWFKITPQKFFIQKNQAIGVLFDVFVPEYAQDGKYKGIVRFCFKKR